MYEMNHTASATPPEELKGDGNPVPVGNWVTALTKYEIKTSDKGWRFECEWSIVDGAHKNRKAWTNINYGANDERVKGFAVKDVDRLCYATGVKQVVSLDVFLNIPMVAYWGQEPAVYETDEEGRQMKDEHGAPVVKYKAKNKVGGFKAISAGAIAPAAAAPAAVAPWLRAV